MSEGYRDEATRPLGSRNLGEYREALKVAHKAAEAAICAGDFEKHFVLGGDFHRLADECLAETGVELRNEF